VINSIVSGAGKAFCTGLDVKSIASELSSNSIELLERPEKGKYSNLAQDVGYLWRELNFPVICVLHGICFGGGMQIALGIRISMAAAMFYFYLSLFIFQGQISAFQRRTANFQ
jgi:enoyl-CoA hydratase/carnithine racemase